MPPTEHGSLELNVEVDSGKAPSQGLGYVVGVRLGGVSKQNRYDPLRPFRFPLAADRLNCRIDLYRHVGTSHFSADPELLGSRKLVLEALEPESQGLEMTITQRVVGNSEAAQRKPGSSSKALSAKQYLQDQRVEETVALAVRRVIKERPYDAHAFLAEFFRSSSITAPTPLPQRAATSLDQPRPVSTSLDQPQRASTSLDQPQRASTSLDQPHEVENLKAQLDEALVLHNKYAKEMQQLRDLHAFQLQDLHSQNAKLKKDSNEFESLQEENTKLKEQVSGMKQLDSLRVASADLFSAQADLQREHTILLEAYSQLKQEYQDVLSLSQDEHASVHAQCKELQSRHRTLQEEHERLKKALEDVSGRGHLDQQKLETQNAELKRDHQALTEKYAALRYYFAQGADEHARVQAQCEELQSQHRALQEENQRLMKALEDSKPIKNSDLRKQLEDAQKRAIVHYEKFEDMQEEAQLAIDAYERLQTESREQFLASMYARILSTDSRYATEAKFREHISELTLQCHESKEEAKRLNQKMLELERQSTSFQKDAAAGIILAVSHQVTLNGERQAWQKERSKTNEQIVQLQSSGETHLQASQEFETLKAKYVCQEERAADLDSQLKLLQKEYEATKETARMDKQLLQITEKSLQAAKAEIGKQSVSTGELGAKRKSLVQNEKKDNEKLVALQADHIKLQKEYEAAKETARMDKQLLQITEKSLQAAKTEIDKQSVSTGELGAKRKSLVQNEKKENEKLVALQADHIKLQKENEKLVALKADHTKLRKDFGELQKQLEAATKRCEEQEETEEISVLRDDNQRLRSHLQSLVGDVEQLQDLVKAKKVHHAELEKQYGPGRASCPV